MVKYGLILMMICLIASLVLAVVFKITNPIICAQGQKEEVASLSEVLPGIDDFKKNTIDDLNFYEGYLKGSLIGYILRAETPGYSGSIDMLVGIDKEGKIMGIKVLSHQETPGLGAKIAQVMPQEKMPRFLEQFIGKNASTLMLEKNNIQAISGATISSKAVVDGVKKTVSQFLDKIKK